jgi:hypothetical protein
MSHSSALFDPSARIPCSREKIAAYSLLGRKKFPATPRREFRCKTLEPKAFSMLILAEGRRILCCLPAPQGIFPSRGAPLLHLGEPRRLPQVDRDDPASGASRRQCRI